jgi:hypothetical protein
MYLFQPLKDDLIQIEFETSFSGAVGQPAPKRDMDRIFNGKETELGMTGENSGGKQRPAFHCVTFAHKKLVVRFSC